MLKKTTIIIIALVIVIIGLGLGLGLGFGLKSSSSSSSSSSNSSSNTISNPSSNPSSNIQQNYKNICSTAAWLLDICPRNGDCDQRWFQYNNLDKQLNCKQFGIYKPCPLSIEQCQQSL